MNDRIPLSPPQIARVQQVENRPLWSVMIPAYNCSEFLARTIKSVLDQAPSKEFMQIEVIDDCSTDANVEELVRETGKGRVGYFRQEINRGSLRNFETCINRSIGHWIHILHGDDAVKPGFYAEIESLFTHYPSIGAAFTGFEFIDKADEILFTNEKLKDEPGLIEDWISKIGQAQWIQPPAIVVKRSVYEDLGSFFAVHYGEDWEMWVRISAKYPMAHSPKQLAQYRVHGNNITTNYYLSGQSIEDISKVIEIVQHYLPQGKRKTLKKLAKRNYSTYYAKLTDKIYHEYRHPKAAKMLAANALKMQVNTTTVFFALKVHLKLLIRYKLRSLRQQY